MKRYNFTVVQPTSLQTSPIDMLEKNIWIEENENKNLLASKWYKHTITPLSAFLWNWMAQSDLKGGGLVSTFQVQDVQIRFSSATYLTNRRSVVFMKMYTVTSIHCEIKALISYNWYM